MTIGEIIAIIGVCIVALGLIGTWVRNGRSQSAEFGGLKSDVKSINDKLDDPNNGLSALNTKISAFQTTCAETRAGFAERIKGNENDIKELKKKRR